MNLSEKISTVVNHPRPFYKLFTGVKNRVGKKLNKRKATAWCKPKAVKAETAFKILGVTFQEGFYKRFEKEANASHEQIVHSFESGYFKYLEVIYQLTKHVKATRVIETGVAGGWSSTAFLIAVEENGGGRLASTDLMQKEQIGRVVPEYLKKKWILIEEPDITGIDKALRILPQIDICHYDSDKTYKGRMFAYPKFWHALRPGGILISDDVGDNLAFSDFAERVVVEPIVVDIGSKYVGILVKS